MFSILSASSPRTNANAHTATPHIDIHPSILVHSQPHFEQVFVKCLNQHGQIRCTRPLILKKKRNSDSNINHTHHALTMSGPPSTVHPVLNLINRCDELARTFDSTFESSCSLLTNLANGTPSGGGGGRTPTTMDETLMVLRATLEKCEEVVGMMLNCIYEDIPHLLDQLDNQGQQHDQAGGNGGVGVVGNWNPKQALDGISQLFYVRSSPSPSLLIHFRSFCERSLTHLPLFFLLYPPPSFSLQRVDHSCPRAVVPRTAVGKARVAGRFHMRGNHPATVRSRLDPNRHKPHFPTQTTSRRPSRPPRCLLNFTSPTSTTTSIHAAAMHHHDDAKVYGFFRRRCEAAPTPSQADYVAHNLAHKTSNCNK